MDLETGDIIVKHTWGTGLISAFFCWRVRAITRSEWNHAAIVVDPKNMVEALGRGVVMRRAQAYSGRRRSFYTRVFRPDFPSMAKGIAAEYAKDKVGYRYDYRGAWGMRRAINSYRLDRKNELDEPDRFFCSELIGAAYEYAGCYFVNPKTVHPSNLAPGDLVLCHGGWIK